MAELRRLAIILGLMVVTISISYARIAYAGPPSPVAVNGKPPGVQEIHRLGRPYGQAYSGRFRYDRSPAFSDPRAARRSS